MNPRMQRFGSLGLFAALACSSGARATATRAPAATSVAPPASVTAVQRNGTAGALEVAAESPDPDVSESERQFIENAERAIGQYSEFLARAGDREEYAHAIQRSREQIQDLRAAIDFVRAGAAARALH